MAEFDDIDEMLESTFKATTNGNGDHVGDGKDKSEERDSRKKRSRSRSGSKSRSRKKRSRSRSRDKTRKHRSKSRSNSKDRKKRRSKSKDRKRRSRSKDRHRRSRSRSRTRRHRSKERRRSRERKRSPSPPKFRGFRGGRGFSPSREYRIDPKTGVMSLPGGRGAGVDNLTPEERDARTVFCMQLSQRVRPRDLEEFFSSVGKVRDVKLITDTKTRRSKGIAYVEFYEVEAVPLAMALAGEKLMGVPIIVQHTQAEKNRAAQASNPVAQTQKHTGPMKLYVGSLHFNITESMLRGIFEPFGTIDNIVLITDQETGRSKGYGFVTFKNPEDAKKALEQLNGFELAGRAMRVGHVTDRNENFHHHQGSQLDSDVVDRTGIDLGATGRLQLMAKLAEGTGLEMPAAAANALSLSQQISAPPISTQCFLISNMFDPVQAAALGDPNWDAEIRDDIIEECNKHGGVLHVFIDKQSPQGNVYVKCPSVAIATSCVNTLHGRWFAGRIITVAYVPVVHYHQLFPDVAALTNQFLETRRSAVGGLIPGGVFPM